MSFSLIRGTQHFDSKLHTHSLTSHWKKERDRREREEFFLTSLKEFEELFRSGSFCILIRSAAVAARTAGKFPKQEQKKASLSAVSLSLYLHTYLFFL